MAKAELFDGTVLDFEDGTPDEVIGKVAKRETDRIRTEQARQPLPEDVKPSEAGAGRGGSPGKPAPEQTLVERASEIGPGPAKSDLGGVMTGIRQNEGARQERMGQAGSVPLPAGVTPSTAGQGRSSGVGGATASQARAAEGSFKDKQEALDEAVNFIDEGVPADRVYEQFGKIGVGPADIQQHGLARGSAFFKDTKGTAAGTARAGGEIQPTPTPDRSMFAVVNDTMINTANAAATIAKTVPDLMGPGGTTSKRIDKFVKDGQRAQSEWQKAKREKLSESLSSADGEVDKAGAYLYHAIVEDPLSTLSEAAGNVGPFALVGKAMAGLKAGQITAGSMAVAGAAGAGEVRGNIWEAIHTKSDADLRKISPEYEQLRRGGMDEDAAKREIGANLVRNLPELVAVGAVTALGGKFGLEAIATGAKISTGRISAGLIGLADEGSQGAIEQLATNLAIKRAVPGQKLTDDVLMNAVAEGLVGGVSGVVAGGRNFAAEMKYERARELGLNVNPPLLTDTPDVQHSKTVGVFKAVAAKYGIDPAAVKRAMEVVEGLPADDVGPFLKRLTDVLTKKTAETGAPLVRKPIDPHASDLLAAGPMEETPEAEPQKDEPKAEAAPAAPGLNEEAINRMLARIEAQGRDDVAGLRQWDRAAAPPAAEAAPPPRSAEPADPSEPIETDVMTKAGNPFATERSAKAALKNHSGAEVVPVVGGYVVRATEATKPGSAKPGEYTDVHKVAPMNARWWQQVATTTEQKVLTDRLIRGFESGQTIDQMQVTFGSDDHELTINVGGRALTWLGRKFTDKSVAEKTIDTKVLVALLKRHRKNLEQREKEEGSTILGSPKPTKTPLLTADGNPFATERSAQRVLKDHPGAAIVPVVGGFVVRRPNAAQSLSNAAPNGPAAEPVELAPGITAAAPIDHAAHAAAESPTNDLPEPTDAQKIAGNYPMGHHRLGGLDLSIENPQGSIRRSKADSPVKWEREMTQHYGYIKGTVGMDGDHIDVFVKPGTPDDFNGTAFVVDQRHKNGKPDEHKVMLGFDTIEEAREAYLSNYSEGWTGLKAITAAPMSDFKAWLRDGDTTKEFAQTPAAAPAAQPEEPTREEANASAESAPEVPAAGAVQAEEKGLLSDYTTRKGKVIRGYWRDDFSEAQAKAVDPFSFNVKGKGWFIREKHGANLPALGEPNKATAGVENPRAAEQPAAEVPTKEAAKPEAPTQDAINEALRLDIRNPGRLTAAALQREIEAAKQRRRETDAKIRAEIEAESAPAPAPAPADDLDAMFDDLMAEKAPAAALEPTVPAGVRRNRVTKEKRARTATAAAASAAMNTGKALGNAIDGLGALFSPGKGTFGSGPVFNEDTYAKAKPLFQAALVNLKDAAADLRAAMSTIIDMVTAKFGRETALNMKPYIVRFVQDVRDGNTEEVQDGTRELDQPGPGALEGAPAEDVRPPAAPREAGDGADGRGDGDGGRDARADQPGGDAAGGVGADARDVPVPASRTRKRTQKPAEPGLFGAPGTDAGPEQLRPERGGLNPEENPAPNGPAIPAPQLPVEDFTIEDDLGLGEGGQKTKYRGNVAAIRLLRDLDATGRLASPDEQRVLAKYVGWGGLAQAFDPDKADWATEYAELKALMTPEEHAAAARSTRYAHYTSREIIVDGIYAALRRFGFTGGKTLEAGAAVGNFMGLMPTDMRSAGRFTAIEREPFSSAIARHLYPKQNVQQADFTEFKGVDGYYDAAVGNPPFASDPQTDRSGRKHLSGLSLHNYFFAKAVDMLREGGIMGQVITNSFMDAKSETARRYIGERVRFLGAIRLPNNAFSKNANTEVTTDIVFLQKLPDNEIGGKVAKADAKRWLDTVLYEDKNGKQVALNRYFADNPDMMLGDYGAFGTMYGPDQPALVARPGQDTLALLRAAVERLPADVYQSLADTGTADHLKAAVIALKAPPVREGGYYMDGDRLIQRLTDIAGEARGTVITPETQWTEKTKLGDAGYARIKALSEMRSTVRGLIAAEMADDDSGMGRLRATLNEQYDAYREQHGLLNDPGTLRVFDDDPDFPLLASLENNYNAGIGKAAAKTMGVKPVPASADKSAIFSRRVVAARTAVRKVSTPIDALAVSMAERGKLDAAYIGELLGLEPEAVLKTLSTGDAPALFKDPATDEYVLRDAYLSGNVRTKLAQAREAGMFENAQALEAVQPEDVGAHEITARVGSPWVPESVYEDFARELFGDGAKARVRYMKLNSSYQFNVDGATDVALTNKWGTAKMPGDSILAALLNNRPIKVTYLDAEKKLRTDVEATEAANIKAQDIKDRFGDWLFKDADRAELLVRAYNDTNNNYVTRVYDGSMMTFPGKVPDEIIRFRRHQRNAIARAVQDRTALYDHVVGAGKAQPLDAKVLTPAGWKTMGEIAVGDHVISVDGAPTRVEAVYPQGEKDIFRVVFSDGSSTECCDEHLWLTQTYRERSMSQRGAKLGKEWPAGRARARSLSEIRETLVAPHLGAKNHSIPMVAPVRFNAAPTAMDPYLMGVLLGDGCFRGRGLMFSSEDTDIIEGVRALVPPGCEVVHASRCDYAIRFRRAAGDGQRHPMIDVLRDDGLWGLMSHEKHVPQQYLVNSVEARIALLQGLMDTDGWCSRASVYFTTTSRSLANDVTMLVQSLGGTVSETEKHPTYEYAGVRRLGRVAWNLCLSMPAEIQPFRLGRKAAMVRPKTSYAPRRYIVAVEPVGRKQAQCIRVAHAEHLYVTDNFIVTHNTFTVVAAAMELKRTGLANKPMVVVPNHLVKQWAADFYRLYPGANILTASKKDFLRENRRKFLAKIATGDWDAVVIAHSSFGFIKPAPEFEAAFNSKQIAEIVATIKQVEDDDGDKQQKKRTVKQLEGLKERLENRIKSLRDKPMDDLLDFQQIGVDQLFVDEFHMFKNLMFSTKMQNVQGLGDSKGSQRAYDMYVKINQIYAQNGRGQGFVAATGTPVSNSLAEMYHMMRYLMPEAMEANGFGSFDAWANTFASVDQVWMQKPSGDGFKASNRMSNFVNTPELLKMFDQVSDTVTQDDIKTTYREENDGAEFPLPVLKTGRRQPVSLEKSPAQEAYMVEIANRAKVLEQRKGPPKKGEDNTLVIMGDARKAAMDIRLVDPNLTEREPGGRIDRAAQEIEARYRQYHHVLGTQVVFSDLGTPLSRAKAEMKEYEELRARIEAATEDVQADAALGKESAKAIVEDADDAQAELDAMGDDWLGAVKAALRGFSVYDDLRKALVERGIPEKEVAFIHEYNTDDQKATLFKKVNAGQIRVLIGSTAKMGAGTNVQERLVAEHHLDVPWRPSDVEQREGRIIRQGNTLVPVAGKNVGIPGFEVEILAYVTRDTLDMRMWQIQETKLKMINQLRSRKVAREIDNAFEDMEMSAGEMQAAATGNVDLLKEIQLRTDVKKLEQRQRSFDAQASDLKSRRARAERLAQTAPAEVKKWQPWADAAAAWLASPPPAVSVKINGAEFTDRDAAGKELLRLLDAHQAKLDARKEAQDAAKAAAKAEFPGEDGESAAKRLNAAEAFTKANPMPKLAVDLDGTEYNSKVSLAEAYTEVVGDATRFDWKFDGKSYIHRQKAAAAVADLVAEAVNSQSEQEIGKFGPFTVSVEGMTNRVTGPRLDVMVRHEGRTISDDIAAPVTDPKQNALNAMERAQQLVTGARHKLMFAENDAQRAAKQLAELGAEQAAGEWPDRQKLEAARAAHKEVLARLSAKKAPEAGADPDAEQPMSFDPAQTDTPAFKRWFGDSKVVDAQGKPLVVYHGTAFDFATFDKRKIGTNYGVDKKGFFFSDDAGEASGAAQDARYTANRASYAAGSGADARAAPNVMPVYLSIKTPLIVQAPAGIDAPNHLDENKEPLLRKAGRARADGIIVRGENSSSYVVFNPKQIKSAIGNRGTFDPNDADIRMDRGTDDFPDTEIMPRPEVDEIAGPDPEDQRILDQAAKNYREKQSAAFGTLQLTALPELTRPRDDAPQAAKERYAAVQLAQKVFGKRIIFYRANIPFANGFQASWAPGHIFIAESTKRPVMAVLGHEMLHGLRNDNQALYNKLRDRLGAVMDNPGAYHQAVASKYAQAKIKPLDFDKTREELIADIVGDFFTERAFWQQVASGQPTLFAKVLKAVRDFLNGVLAKLQSVRPYGTERYLSDVRAARDIVAEAIGEFAAAAQSGQRLGPVYAEAMDTGASDPFYSALAREVALAKMGAAPAAGWKDFLKGLTAKGAVKADEIAWTGIEDWLDTQPGKVTRDQVRDYLAANGVRVTETVLSDRTTRTLPDGWRVADNGDGTFSVLDEESDEQGEGTSEEEAIANAQDDDAYQSTPGAPKYAQYTLPGGTNYREVLLTLPDGRKDAPEQAERMKVVARADGNFDVVDKDGVVKSFRKWDEASAYAYDQQQAENIKRNLAWQKSQPATYKSGHWDTTNVLAHIRLNDRTDAEGKKALFVEEIQSDWGQAGKKQGFGSDKPAPVRFSVRDANGNMRGDFGTREEAQAYLDSPPQHMRHLFDYTASVRETQAPALPGVPAAPFVGKTDAWVALALKRVVKMAVDGGYDRVAFVTGEQSANRYSLSKQVDSINWAPYSNGTTLVEVNIPGSNALQLAVDKAGKVESARGPGFDGMAGKGLDDIIGKEVAKRILSEPKGKLAGDGLNIGGEGMKAFYDKIVPSVAKDVLKKLDGQLTQVSVAGESKYEKLFPSREAAEEWAEANLGDHAYRVYGASSASNTFAVYDEFTNRAVSDVAQLTQPGFDITPAMREKAGGGLPMFDLGDQPMSFGDEDARTPSFARRIANTAHDMLDSPQTFNWWHKSIGTQFHKAKISPLFRRVFETGQEFIHDTAAFANRAADLAPNLLPSLDKFTDLFKRLALTGADQRAVAQAVFEGTLDERIWTPAELTARGMTPRQQVLYQQMRQAVNKSLDILVAAEVARTMGDTAADLKHLVQADELAAFREQARERINVRRDAADEALAAAKKRHKKELADLEKAQAAEAKIPANTRPPTQSLMQDRHKDAVNGMKLRQGGERHRAEQELAKWEQMEFDVADKYEKIENLKDNGYAPLMRFGHYTVTVMGEDEDGNPVTEFFGMYESKLEMNRAAREARADYPDATSVETGTVDPGAWKAFRGVSPETLAIFGAATGIDKGSEAYQEYLKLAVANHSALKRLIHRKGTPGFSKDPTRVLAAFLTSNARRSSQMIHFGDLQAAAEAARRSRAGDVSAEARKLAEALQESPEDGQAVAMIKGLGFVMYLGGSVASAAVNMTQTVTTTLPYLSSHSNPAKASAEIGQAMTQLATRIDPAGDLGRALKRADEEGITSPQEMHQLQAEATRTIIDMMPAIARTTTKRLGFAWGAMFSFAEQVNRRIAFVAAFNMANGMSEAELRAAASKARLPEATPFAFAANAVDETQFLYNKGSFSNWARNPVGSLLLMFKTYPVSYLELFKRMPMREKVLMLVTMILMAGAGGIPFADNLDDLIDSIGQRMGYDTNAKDWKRKFLGAQLGPQWAAFVERGVSGIAGVPIDVAGRLGMGAPLPATGLLRKDVQNAEREVFELFGPMGSYANGLVETARGDGNKAFPVAIQNAIKAADMWRTGAYRDQANRTVIKTNGTDAAVKALGFQPSIVAQDQAISRTKAQRAALQRLVEREIASDIAEGIFSKRPEIKNEAIARLKKWNKNNPNTRIEITDAQIERRLENMAMSRSQRLQKATPREMRGQ